MGKFKLGNTGTVTIFNKNTGEVIAEQEVKMSEGKVDQFLNEYLNAYNSNNYEENKDAIRNNLINKHFLSQ